MLSCSEIMAKVNFFGRLSNQKAIKKSRLYTGTVKRAIVIDLFRRSGMYHTFHGFIEIKV